MSKRSELRQAAMERAGGVCEFPSCTLGGKLEMAHLKGSGMGGSKYRDVIENLACLCGPHHQWLDGGLMPNSRRYENEQILRAVLDRPWKMRR